MEKFALVGSGISHSGSPTLFGAAYGGRYTYDLVDLPSDGKPDFRKILSLYRAVNITAPFKEEAFRQAVQLTKEGEGSISGPCMRIRATNLLCPEDLGNGKSGICAHNSDFSGIILSVAEALWPGVVSQCYTRYPDKGHIRVHQFARGSILSLYSRKPQALVIGAGGAARAAVVAACEMGFSTAVMNRTASKAEALSREYSSYDVIPVPLSDLAGAIQECDLVLYCAAGPLEGLANLRAEHFDTPDRYRFLCPGKIILEANYKNPSFNPAQISLMHSVGCQYIGGERWLRYQALSGYTLMTGGIPPSMEDLMRVELG